MQHLVGVGVADAGDDPLVAEYALDLHPASGQEARQRVLSEVGGQRVRPEGGHPGHLGRVADQVHGEALVRALLGQVEPGAIVQPQPEGQRALTRLRRRSGQVVAPA